MKTTYFPGFKLNVSLLDREKVVCSMDINGYLTGKAKWEKYLGNDNEYSIESYEAPVDIATRIEGGNRYIRNAEGALEVSEMCYWSTEDVKLKDKINGQEVKSVKPIYDFDMTLIYKEVYV
jgi:hypothetical protein